MAALGLLLMIVVIGAVVYIAGVPWLALRDARQDKASTRDGQPKRTQSGFLKAPGDIGEGYWD